MQLGEKTEKDHAMQSTCGSTSGELLCTAGIVDGRRHAQVKNSHWSARHNRRRPAQ